MHTKENYLTPFFCSAFIVAVAITIASPEAAFAQMQHGLDLERDTLTQTVLIHPVIDASGDGMTLWTREHTYRPSLGLGDQLARDFTLARVGDDGLPRTYRPGTDGARNEDWFGWRGDVLAPFDGTVTRTQTPSSTNAPGTMNREARPGGIFFENDKGVTVLYGHVREIEVKEGQRVEAGDVVAKVGNNANSRAPHIHVGAWVDETPLQIQIDLYAAERFAGDAERSN
jgi:hypothetical protein